MTDPPTLNPAPAAKGSRARGTLPQRASRITGSSARWPPSAAAAAADASAAVAPMAPSRRDAFFRRLLAAADVGAAAGGLTTLAVLGHHGVAAVSLLSLPIIVLYAKATGRYDHDDVVLRKSTLDEMPALLTLAAAYAITWSLVVSLSGVRTGMAGGATIVVWAATATLLVGLRLAARGAAQRSAPRERVLIVGDSLTRSSLARCIAADPGAHADVVGFLPLEDERRSRTPWKGPSRRRVALSFADLPTVVRDQDIDRVMLIPTSGESELMLDAVRRTTNLGIKVSIVPRLFEVVGSAVEFDSVGGITLLGVRPAGLTRSSRFVKRTTDLAAALIGLLILAPLGALIALAIKLDTPGPVFFRQRRVGRDGQHFAMIKFRSMVDGAEAGREALHPLNESSGTFKLTTDPRVTRVGHWLRRTSIDELPQLINVLRGEMSLVGPRPLVADEDRLVEGVHRHRLAMAPGITGPWQVLGPRRPPLSEMVKIDYLYAANWSLWSDLKIILRTFAHMLGRRGE